MDDRSKEEMNKYYSNLLDIHGPNVEAMGIGFKTKDQKKQKFFLSSQAGALGSRHSILDVGCGLGYLCDYYRDLGWKGRYTGIDINSKMLEAAKKRLPNEEFLCVDILQEDIVKKYDHVYCISTIQHKPKFDDAALYLKRMIAAMFSLTEKVLVFDVFTDKVEFMNDENLYFNPAQLLEYCQTLTSRLTLRHDYRPFQYMMYLYKDTLKNEQNIFVEWDENNRGINKNE